VPFIDSDHCQDQGVVNADVVRAGSIISLPGGGEFPIFRTTQIAPEVVPNGVATHSRPIGKPAVEFLQWGRGLTPLDGTMKPHHFFPGFTGFLISFLGRGLAEGLVFFVWYLMAMFILLV
jgi:hypothetical protein